LTGVQCVTVEVGNPDDRRLLFDTLLLPWEQRSVLELNVKTLGTEVISNLLSEQIVEAMETEVFFEQIV
jgi:hypothetical protein